MWSDCKHVCTVSPNEITSQGRKVNRLWFSGGSSGAIEAIHEIARRNGCRIEYTHPGSSYLFVSIDLHAFPKFMDDMKRQSSLSIVYENANEVLAKIQASQHPKIR